MYSPSTKIKSIAYLMNSQTFQERLKDYRLPSDKERMSLEEKLAHFCSSSIREDALKFDLAQEIVCIYLSSADFYDLQVKELKNSTLNRSEFRISFKIGVGDSSSISLTFPTEQDKFKVNFGTVRLQFHQNKYSTTNISCVCRGGEEELKDLVNYYHLVGEVLELFDTYDAKWNANHQFGDKFCFLSFTIKNRDGEPLKLSVEIDTQGISEVKVEIEDEEIMSFNRHTNAICLIRQIESLLRVI